MGRIEVTRGLYCGPDKGNSHFCTSMDASMGQFSFFFCKSAKPFKLVHFLNKALSLQPHALFERINSLSCFNLYINFTNLPPLKVKHTAIISFFLSLLWFPLYYLQLCPLVYFPLDVLLGTNGLQAQRVPTQVHAVFILQLIGEVFFN